MAKDYYAVLGLARGADDVVVHAAWKALLRKYHPDTNGGGDAQARAREINEAFAVLGKPQSRAAYDRSRAAQSPRPAAQRQPPPRPGTAYRAAPPHYRAPPKASLRRTPAQSRRIAAALMLLTAVPAAILALNQYPDALPDLRYRIGGYADFGAPAIATFTPATYTGADAESPAAPPPVDPAIVSAAVRRAVAVVHKGGIPAAVHASRRCDGAAQDWPALDDCIAFDIAVSLVEATLPGALDAPDPYFMLAGQRDALRAERMDRDPDRVGDRIAVIRAMVVPRTMAILIGQPGRTSDRSRNPVTALSLR